MVKNHYTSLHETAPFADGKISAAGYAGFGEIRSTFERQRIIHIALQETPFGDAERALPHCQKAFPAV